MFANNSIPWKKEAEAQRQIFAPEENEMAENSFAAPIDLSRPPVVPYSHQKFPKMLYDHKASRAEREEMGKVPSGVQGFLIDAPVHVPAHIVTCIVQGEDELQAKLKEGWSEKPPDFSKRK